MPPIFFWRDTNPSFAFLSQDSHAPFHDNETETVWPTTEHYMLSEMAMLFGAPDIAARIAHEPRVEDIRDLARGVDNFDEKIWEEDRYGIVEEATYHKFAHSLVRERDLKAALLATGEDELVLASPLDGIWGIGYEAGEAVGQRETWGRNLLGKALMMVRAWIRMEETGSASWEKGGAFDVTAEQRRVDMPLEVQTYEAEKGYISPSDHKYWDTERGDGLAAEYYDKTREFGPPGGYPNHGVPEAQEQTEGSRAIEGGAPEASGSDNALAALGALGAGGLVLHEARGGSYGVEEEEEENSDDELRKEVIENLFRKKPEEDEASLADDSEDEKTPEPEKNKRKKRRRKRRRRKRRRRKRRRKRSQSQSQSRYLSQKRKKKKNERKKRKRTQVQIQMEIPIRKDELRYECSARSSHPSGCMVDDSEVIS
ncbi:hypothetical protein VE02_10085 [Pseudogymnoascus sp. 03VT05]|nr:hypothetical protein VE02_10085 [Pseudogymnoascus sp. 03VT05]